MPRYNLFTLTGVLVLAVLTLANVPSAQYWFQSGARGSNDVYFNNGFSVQIQTIYQTPTLGSLGFWGGERLSNGAFVQIGYEISNSTGYYAIQCGNSTMPRYLTAGRPAWFWEYFTVSDNQLFCGGIGPDGSAGANGSFNTYSFRSLGGDIWGAYFNNELLGKVNLSTNNSGTNPPYALAEYADTNTDTWPLSAVRFKNLAYYEGKTSKRLTTGYSVINYGKDSLTALPNPYGVQEVGNFSDYFIVASKLPALNSTTLWGPGYVALSYTEPNGSGGYYNPILVWLMLGAGGIIMAFICLRAKRTRA
jgi:hypothetical protein